MCSSDLRNMPRYQVQVQEVHTVSIFVDAPDEYEAKLAAEQIIADGCYDDDSAYDEPEYTSTLERDEWPVYKLADDYPVPGATNSDSMFQRCG